MRKSKPRVISVHANEADYSAISNVASEQKLTVSTFMRLASLERANVRPFFSEEDLVILQYLRDELKDRGLQLMDHVRALNWGEADVDVLIKTDILKMSRTIAALCVELKSCVRVGTRRPHEERDATN